MPSLCLASNGANKFLRHECVRFWFAYEKAESNANAQSSLLGQQQQKQIWTFCGTEFKWALSSDEWCRFISFFSFVKFNVKFSFCVVIFIPYVSEQCCSMISFIPKVRSFSFPFSQTPTQLLIFVPPLMNMCSLRNVPFSSWSHANTCCELLNHKGSNCFLFSLSR